MAFLAVEHYRYACSCGVLGRKHTLGQGSVIGCFQTAVEEGTRIERFPLSLFAGFLIVAARHYTYVELRILLSVWSELWWPQRVLPEEAKAEVAKIVLGSNLPRSEDVVRALLRESGFGDGQRLFHSLFLGGLGNAQRSLSVRRGIERERQRAFRIIHAT